MGYENWWTATTHWGRYLQECVAHEGNYGVAYTNWARKPEGQRLL